MAIPQVTLSQGIHVMHLFHRVNRVRWAALPAGESAAAMAKLGELCAANPGPGHPRLCTYANVGGKADFGFMLYHADLAGLGAMHRALEACFPPGTLEPVYSYLSVTELTEYMSTEEDVVARLKGEGLQPGSEPFEKRLTEEKRRLDDYKRFRLYPEMDDWEAMCFYPMNKKRDLADNWYMLDAVTRKKLMGGHARVGRKYHGRVSQLITGSVGLDDWEWGVTLIAHQVDALKEIVYEMRFDEVSARYGEFGTFYVNLRLDPADLWEHLRL
jgi:chlorite dismutase